jgi:hypothetical protein
MTYKTKQEIKRFYEIKLNIEEYHSQENQIVPRPSEKVPKRKQTVDE